MMTESDALSAVFQSEGRARFEFLQRTYGMTLVEAAPDRLVYLNELVGVVIAYGTRSFEVRVAFGLRDQEGRYRLEDALEMLGELPSPEGNFFQASTTPRLERVLSRAADALATHCDPFLQGHPGYYRRLEEFRREKAVESARARQVADARRTSKAAWNEGDYARVVQLLEPIRDALPPSDEKRLALAIEYLAD